jgi:D-lactate dehydrogenase (cytochrome)
MLDALLPAAVNRVAETLSALPDDRLIRSRSRRALYAQSEGHHRFDPPDLVVQPRDVNEVQAVVRACRDHGVPLIPYGAGTSLEGNAAALHGGVALDLSRMDAIMEVSERDLLCVVQPGVTRKALNTHLRDTGLFFPVDPGANATLGGMIATRASGTNAVRYGTMRENTLGLTVVLPNGEIVKTGTRARKSAAGYDLTHLFVGSEGTLGVVVDATLRLHGLPETVLAATCAFESLAGAVDTVMLTIQCGVPIARIELLDSAAIGACNAHGRLGLPEAPTLFLEFHGSAASIEEQRAAVAAIAADFGGSAFAVAYTAEERSRLWAARHAALPAARASRPGAVAWVTDICVPISRLAEAINDAQRRIAEAGLVAPILGHVGDGNFHVFFILDPSAPDEWARARSINEAMVAFALSCGGTCTGEHGIGVGKQTHLLAEAGEVSVDLMQTLKRAIDPLNILNPGKIIASQANER